VPRILWRWGYVAPEVRATASASDLTGEFGVADQGPPARWPLLRTGYSSVKEPKRSSAPPCPAPRALQQPDQFFHQPEQALFPVHRREGRSATQATELVQRPLALARVYVKLRAPSPVAVTVAQLREALSFRTAE
jgi:hypothetical protein